MLGIKDLESLRKSSSILSVPFFSFALIADGVLGWLAKSLAGLMNLGFDPDDQGAMAVVGFVVLVTVVLFVLEIFDIGLFRVEWWMIRLFRKDGDDQSSTPFVRWVGLLLLTAGLFAFSSLISGLPASPLNPAWHLGFLAYGWSVIDRGNRG